MSDTATTNRLDNLRMVADFSLANAGPENAKAATDVLIALAKSLPKGQCHFVSIRHDNVAGEMNKLGLSTVFALELKGGGEFSWSQEYAPGESLPLRAVMAYRSSVLGGNVPVINSPDGRATGMAVTTPCP